MSSCAPASSCRSASASGHASTRRTCARISSAIARGKLHETRKPPCQGGHPTAQLTCGKRTNPAGAVALCAARRAPRLQQMRSLRLVDGDALSHPASVDGCGGGTVRRPSRLHPPDQSGKGGTVNANETFFEQLRRGSDVSGKDGHRPPSDVSGKRVVYGNSCGLDEVVAAFDELLLLPDHGAVYVALAGIVANYATAMSSGRCSSARLAAVSPRSSRAPTSAPGVWALSSLTPQTLLSGFERKGEPASLLLQIGDVRDPRVQGPDDGADDAPRGAGADHRAAARGRRREDGEERSATACASSGKASSGWSPASPRSSTSSTRSSRSWASGSCSTGCPRFRAPDIARRSLARRGHEPELRARIRATVGDFLEQFQRLRAARRSPNASRSRSSCSPTS